MTGDEALPRKNGELVFEEPWEGRAFGLAVAMNEGGIYGWADFRDRLVETTAADEKHGEHTGYYQRWVRALSGWPSTAGSSHRQSSTRGPEHSPLTSSAASRRPRPFTMPDRIAQARSIPK